MKGPARVLELLNSETMPDGGPLRIAVFVCCVVAWEGGKKERNKEREKERKNVGEEEGTERERKRERERESVGLGGSREVDVIDVGQCWEMGEELMRRAMACLVEEKRKEKRRGADWIGRDCRREREGKYLRGGGGGTEKCTQPGWWICPTTYADLAAVLESYHHHHHQKENTKKV